MPISHSEALIFLRVICYYPPLVGVIQAVEGDKGGRDDEMPLPFPHIQYRILLMDTLLDTWLFIELPECCLERELGGMRKCGWVCPPGTHMAVPGARHKCLSVSKD